MYKTFYKLQRNPFEISPDPSFLFPTKRHNEALAALYYGVRRHKGFVVMTGEVGTGKTMLVRCLLQLLNRNNVSYAYIFNSRLSPHEFLQYIAGDFGLTVTGKSKGELLLELSQYLIARHQKNLTTVLVVDEAHHVSEDVLEEIRLLTNLETTQEKLLQILLVGQPELDEKLDSVQLRQLKQRIALRSQLEPLDLEETRGYIHRRLQLAGSTPEGAMQLFPDDTIERVHHHSRGIPRLINTVCENALITSFAKKSNSVASETVEEVASDFRLAASHPATQPASADSKPAFANNGATSGGTNGGNNQDALQAIKTLLQLHEYLQSMRSGEVESTAAVLPGAVKQ
jgi:general secretion pathway protein A